MIFDLYLTRHAVVKLNGEGGVALDDRRGRGGRAGGRVRVFGGDLVELRPQGFGVLKVLGGDLEVAGLAVVRREDVLWLWVGHRKVAVHRRSIFVQV